MRKQIGFVAIVLADALLLLALVSCGPVLPFLVPAESPVNSDGAPARETISFSSSWSSDPTQGGFAVRQGVRTSSIAADTLTSHGQTCARVEVRPGDDPLGSASGERAEVAIMKSRGQRSFENAASGSIFIGTSYELPTTWQSSASATSGWSIVLELHGPDTLNSTSPAIALNATDQYSLTIDAGDLKTAAPYTLNFSDPSLNLGSWTDFMIEISLSPSSTGNVTVWRRNEGQMEFTKVAWATGVPTLQFDSRQSNAVGDHYWKQGLFRGDGSSITNVLWMGPIVRGPSFASVENAAFGTHAGEP